MDKEEERNRRYKTDWVGLFALLLIVIGGGILIAYLVVQEVHPCTKSPIEYLADDWSKESGMNYTYAKLYLFLNEDDIVPVKIFEIKKEKERNR